MPLRLRKIDPLHRLILTLFAFAITLSVFGYIQVHGAFNMLAILNDFYANVSTEFISIVITVLFVDRLSRERERERDLRNSLMQAITSGNNDSIRHAIYEMGKKGWLRDESLVGLRLRKVDLRAASLNGANLEGADLRGANLEGADLSGVNLRGSLLIPTPDLSRNSVPPGANLCGANLRNARLENANFWRATCDVETTLPDGRKWVSDDDFLQFGVVFDRQRAYID